jgi:flagellar biosynthesis/type III secretory pathway protein FliH
MCLSRRLARDWLQAGDVRPYEPREQHGTDEQNELHQPRPEALELECLDLLNLGPYLLLLHAREAAEAHVANAESEASLIRERSRLEGAAQGRREGKEEVLPAAVAFANAGQALIVFEEQMVSRYTPEMVRLAFQIAEKIIQKTAPTDPEIIASILQRARQEIPEARHIRVRINPQDHQLLAEMRPDLVKIRGDSGRTIEVVPDEEIGRGGCKLETEIGVVDATMPTQLEELRRQLLDEANLAGVKPDSFASSVKIPQDS